MREGSCTASQAALGGCNATTGQLQEAVDSGVASFESGQVLRDHIFYAGRTAKPWLKSKASSHCPAYWVGDDGREGGRDFQTPRLMKSGNRVFRNNLKDVEESNERLTAYCKTPPSAPNVKVVTDFTVSGQGCVAVDSEKAASDQCMPLRVEATDDPLIVKVGGKYTRGDLRPLAPLKKVGLKDRFIDIVVIRADETTPLVLDIVADLGAVGTPRPLMTVSMSGQIDISLPLFGFSASLRMNGLGFLTVGGIGDAGFRGALVAEIDEITLPVFGRLGGVATSISSLDGGIELDVLGEKRNVAKGIGKYWKGPAPLSLLCPADVFLNMSVFDATSIFASFSCPMDYVSFDRRVAPRRIGGVTLPQLLIPSVKYVRLAGMEIGADIIPGKATFFVTGAFEIATTHGKTASLAHGV